MPCPAHPPWLDHSIYTWRRVQIMKWLNEVTLINWIISDSVRYYRACAVYHY
jgi:hypothetical protein